MNNRELHIELIQKVLLPHLSVLSSGTYIKAVNDSIEGSNQYIYQRNIEIIPVPKRALHFVSSIKEARINFLQGEYTLRKAAVQILGNLFCSASGEREYRASFIEILKRAALSDDCLFSDHEEIEEVIDLKITAIKQLEQCLSASFTVLPQSHGSVPVIVEALCSIVKEFSYRYKSEALMGKPATKRAPVSVKTRLRLIFTALIPLVRMRISFDGRAKFSSRSNILRNFPVQILKFLHSYSTGDPKLDEHTISDGSIEYGNFDHVEDDDYDEDLSSYSDSDVSDEESCVAPFLFIQRTPSYRPSTVEKVEIQDIRGKTPKEIEAMHVQSTTLSLHIIFETVAGALNFLHLGREGELAAFEKGKMFCLVRTYMRSMCYKFCADAIHCDAKLSTNENGNLLLGPTFELDSYKLRNDENVMEFIERSRACVAYAGYTLRCYYLQMKIKLQEISYPYHDELNRWKINLKSVSTSLLKCCMSDNLQETMHGCNGLSLLISGVFGPQPLNFEIDHSWVINVFELISDRIKRIWNSSNSHLIHTSMKRVIKRSGGNDIENQVQVDPIVPLLSILNDIFYVWKETMAFELPTSLVKDTCKLCFHMCKGDTLNLTWFSRQGKLLAMKCAVFCVTSLPPFAANDTFQSLVVSSGCDRSTELNIDIQETLEHNPKENKNDDTNLKDIVLDVLKRQTIECPSKSVYNTKLHDHNAVESEEISTFLVDSHGSLERKSEAYWLYEDSILSIRFGSKSTRLRGWVEIVIRSPAHRHRRLLRLPDKISIEQPNFTSTLSNPHFLYQSLKKVRVESDVDREEIENDESEAFSHAKKMIERFHLIVGQRLINNKLFHQRHSHVERLNSSENKDVFEIGEESKKTRLERSHSADSSNALFGVQRQRLQRTNSVGSHSRLFGTTKSFEMHKQDKQSRYQTSRNQNSSSRALQRDTYMINEESDNDENSQKLSGSSVEGGLYSLKSKSTEKIVHSWLESIVGQSSPDIKMIEEELLMLGFSDSTLGISYHPEVEDMDNSTSRVKMKPLTAGPKLQRAINILDRTTHLQTHKIGLMFVGPKAISEIYRMDFKGEHHPLNEKYGSPNFLEFANDIGTLVSSRHLKYFSGGLDTSSYASDGEYAFIHISEDFGIGQNKVKSGDTMILFHTLPLMPAGINNRKKHIGNDYVHIVYLEDIEENYNVEDQKGFVSGEFGFVTIFVIPLTHSDTLKIILKLRTDLDNDKFAALAHLTGSVLISKGPSAARYVRNLATRADLACRSVQEDRVGRFSNWEQRLIQIREIIRYASL